MLPPNIRWHAVGSAAAGHLVGYFEQPERWVDLRKHRECSS